MNCIDLTKRSKRKHSKQRKTTQNYESDQIIMNCIDLTSKRSKIWVTSNKTTKVIKLQWICIDLTSKRSKMLSYVAKHSKQRKTTKWSNYELHRFDVIKNVEIRRKTFKTTQNYKRSNYNEFHRFDVKTITTTQNYESDQIIMHCINLTSKRSKKLSYVPKHSKQRKTTKVIKLQWIASIWRQNDHNNAKLRKWSNYNALHQFDVKTI